MNKVITINLNGRAYQLEEDGFQMLQQYLHEAEDKLSQDAGKQEIVNDLEQAIADKCEQFLSKSKTVVSAAEVKTIVDQMGPVQHDTTAGDPSSQDGSAKQQFSAGPKRLYQISEGSMISGVCIGLASYFNVDVTVIRIIFVILTLLTHGLWILVYIVMMITIPHATTSAEKAAASGAPFTAQEFINRAREEYTKFSKSDDWRMRKREWKQKFRQNKREVRQQIHENIHPVFISPFWGIFGSVLALVWVFGIISLVGSHTLFGLMIPANIPLWVAIVGWVFLYSVVAWPVKVARRAAYTGAGGINHYQHNDFLESLAWIAFFIVLGWALWTYVPQSQPYFRDVKTWGIHVWQSIRHH